MGCPTTFLIHFITHDHRIVSRNVNDLRIIYQVKIFQLELINSKNTSRITINPNTEIGFR